MRTKVVVAVALLAVCMMCLCGCAKKCESCGNAIEGEPIKIGESIYCENCVEYCAKCNNPIVKGEGNRIGDGTYCEDCIEHCSNCDQAFVKGEGVEIDGENYCANCVEYCAGCNQAFVKESRGLLVYKDQKYCESCFEKLAYPITLADDKHFSVEIVDYSDSSGMFTIKVKNKTKYEMSVFQEDEHVAMDGTGSCIAETDGTHSFAYATVPAKEEVTVYSSFRKSEKEWESVLKMSEGHTFQFIMNAYNSDTGNGGLEHPWDKTFKVTLKSEMFGYAG